MFKETHFLLLIGKAIEFAPEQQIDSATVLRPERGEASDANAWVGRACSRATAAGFNAEMQKGEEVCPRALDGEVQTFVCGREGRLSWTDASLGKSSPRSRFGAGHPQEKTLRCIL